MISDTAQYHGSFFVMLLEYFEEPLAIERLTELGPGYYLLASFVPVYLKLSTKRKGPWTFNFFRSHQEAQDKLFSIYGECFTCLICGQDGVLGLNMEELRRILDDSFEEQESISVRRRLNAMYQVKGRNGALEHRVSRRSVFEKIHAKITKQKTE